MLGIISRLLSLAIAAGYLVWYLLPASSMDFMTWQICIALLIPLVLIWFPGTISMATGFARGGYSDMPPGLVAGLGWMILVVLPGIAWLLQHAM